MQSNGTNIRLPLTILAEVCRELKLQLEMVDEFSQSIVRVKKGSQHFLAGLGKVGMYPLNPQYSAALASDKAWTYQLLSRVGFRVPKGEYFFVTDAWSEFRPAGKDIPAAVAWAATLGYPVFVKPNDASSGVLAELITNESGLQHHLQRIATKSNIALVQEYLELPEYRLFVVDGQVQFLYQRHKPQVVGDGRTSVIDLITGLNATIPIASHRIETDSAFLALQLAEKNLQLESILPIGVVLTVAAHANVAAGGHLSEYSEAIPAPIHTFATQVTAELGLRVAGIDVFIPGDWQTASPETWTIIEVNSNPNLAGIYVQGYQQTAVKIWKQIISKFFDKD